MTVESFDPWSRIEQHDASEPGASFPFNHRPVLSSMPAILLLKATVTGRPRLICDVPDRVGDGLITDPKRPFPLAFHRPQPRRHRSFLGRMECVVVTQGGRLRGDPSSTAMGGIAVIAIGLPDVGNAP
jgi:hypothetical protein